MKMQKKFEKLKSIEDVSDYNKMVKKISKNHKEESYCYCCSWVESWFI